MTNRCGFRSSNGFTKSGWRSTLGSRVTTDLKADDASTKCSGNINWLNHRGPTFDAVNANHPHQVDRRAFRAGEVFEQAQPVPPLEPNRRHGTTTINRPAFLAPPVEGRKEIDFNQINALNVSQFGSKIQLGEKTLEKLLGVAIPDPGDKSWLDEKDRMKAEGKSPNQIRLNPPFGRQQKTTKKQINFGEAKLSLQGSLAAIKKVVSQNLTETREQKRLLGLEIARVFQSSENIRNMTGRNMVELKAAVDRLRVPLTYQENGFTQRIFDRAQYLDQQGLITLFLLANPGIHNINTPIRSESSPGADPSADTWITLNSLVSALRRSGTKQRYIDLGDRRLITQATAERMVRAGVDDGLLSGVVPEVLEEKEKSGPSMGEIRFITQELGLAMPHISDWKAFVESKTVTELLELYNKHGLLAPKNLVAAVDAAIGSAIEPGEFGVA